MGKTEDGRPHSGMGVADNGRPGPGNARAGACKRMLTTDRARLRTDRPGRPRPAYHGGHGAMPAAPHPTGRSMKTLHDHPVTRRWPPSHPERLQLYSLPTPNGVKVSIAL